MLEFRSNDRFAVIKFFVVALLMFYVLLFLSSDKKNYFKDLKKYFFFLLFIAVCIISTIWSINPYITFINSILLLFFFLSFLKIKNIIGYDLLFPLVPLIILSTIIASIIINGFEGRFIGGNQPNIIGQFAFFGIFFSFFLKKNSLRYVFNISFIIIIILVNSRIYLLSTGLFFITNFFIKNNFKKNIFFTLLSIYLIFCFLFIFTSQFEKLYEILAEYLKIFDEARGLDSNFTGRIDYWLLGIELFKEKMFLGYGFRTRTNITTDDLQSISAHSGLINLLVDTGLLGFIPFLISIFKSIIQKADNLKIRYNHYIISIFPSLILILTFEPVHFYLGLPFNLFLILTIINVDSN